MSKKGLLILTRYISNYSDTEKHKASTIITRDIFEWNTVEGKGYL